MWQLWIDDWKEPRIDKKTEKRLKFDETDRRGAWSIGTRKRCIWERSFGVVPAEQGTQRGDWQVFKGHFGVWKDQQGVAEWGSALLAVRWGG